MAALHTYTSQKNLATLILRGVWTSEGAHQLERNMTSSKKSSIPQEVLDSSVPFDRGKLDPVATQAHGFVKGQTCNATKVAKQLEKSASTSKTKRKSKQERAKKKAKKQELVLIWQ